MSRPRPTQAPGDSRVAGRPHLRPHLRSQVAWSVEGLMLGLPAVELIWTRSQENEP